MSAPSLRCCNMMFPGFRSRCATPAACAACSALPICFRISAARAGKTGPCDNSSLRLTPGTYWMTRNGEPSSSSPTSRMPHDSRMIDPRERVHLLLEAGFQPAGPAPFDTHDLDNDRTHRQMLVVRQVHQRLPARGELPVDAVAIPQHLTAGQAHRARQTLRDRLRDTCPGRILEKSIVRRVARKQCLDFCAQRVVASAGEGQERVPGVGVQRSPPPQKRDEISSHRLFARALKLLASRGARTARSPNPGPQFWGSLQERSPLRAH